MVEIKGGKIILNSNTSDNKYALEISVINLTSENGKTLIWFKLDDSIKCIETKESFDDILEAIDRHLNENNKANTSTSCYARDQARAALRGQLVNPAP